MRKVKSLVMWLKKVLLQYEVWTRQNPQEKDDKYQVMTPWGEEDNWVLLW